MEEETIQLVMNQMKEVQVQHSGLELVLTSGKLRICGIIGFCMDHNSRTIEDTYQVEIHIPNDYPESPPTAFETGNKIDKSFEHFMTDGSLCLGAPLEIRKNFLQHKRLLRFINEQLIVYLFSYSYKRDYGETPFGELAHGGTGIMQYYQDLLRVDDHVAVLGLLKVLADDSYRGHLPCPCGGGSILRRCHGQQLRELSSVQSCEHFSQDVIAVLGSLSENDLKVVFDRSLSPCIPTRRRGHRRHRKKNPIFTDRDILPKSVLKEIDRMAMATSKQDGAKGKGPI